MMVMVSMLVAAVMMMMTTVTTVTTSTTAIPHNDDDNDDCSQTANSITTRLAWSKSAQERQTLAAKPVHQSKKFVVARTPVVKPTWQSEGVAPVHDSKSLL